MLLHLPPDYITNLIYDLQNETCSVEDEYDELTVLSIHQIPDEELTHAFGWVLSGWHTTLELDAYYDNAGFNYIPNDFKYEKWLIEMFFPPIIMELADKLAGTYRGVKKTALGGLVINLEYGE